MNRLARLQLLRDVLATTPLSTQAEVRAALAAHGVDPHPATVGRDLEELGARKVRGRDGELAYRLPATEPAAPRAVLDDALRTFVLSVTSAGNLLVLRTPPACAAPVASALDRAGEAAIVGTLAGDDTVLAVVADGHDPAAVAAELRRRVGADVGADLVPGRGSETPTVPLPAPAGRSPRSTP